MASSAKQQDLLYVSDFVDNAVFVVSYPEGVVDGVLPGFNHPSGLCSDGKGNVFVANASQLNVLEYAHGGTTPIQTLQDGIGVPIGCAIDPKTGNLAVANYYGFQGKRQPAPGTILIYAHATGVPRRYTDPQLYYYFPPTYDERGNLFVQGATGMLVSRLAELRYRYAVFTDLKSNQPVSFPGAVAWDGKYLAVGNQAENGAFVIYDMKVSGSKATRERSLVFDKSCSAIDVFQFWLNTTKGKDATRVIGPNEDCGSVEFWKYPHGGSPTKTLTGFGEPFGVTLSKAQ